MRTFPGVRAVAQSCARQSLSSYRRGTALDCSRITLHLDRIRSVEVRPDCRRCARSERLRADSAIFLGSAGGYGEMLRNTIRVLPLLCCFPAFTQNQATGPSFEAATLNANKSRDVRMAVDFQGGGRFSATNVPLKILIALAYHVRPEAITGGPGWLGSDRFDIVAKASQTTPSD